MDITSPQHRKSLYWNKKYVKVAKRRGIKLYNSLDDEGKRSYNLDQVTHLISALIQGETLSLATWDFTQYDLMEYKLSIMDSQQPLKEPRERTEDFRKEVGNPYMKPEVH